MKKTKTFWNKAFHWALSSLLMLLGFSACDDKECPCMYGSPTADYTIKGKVTNEAGEPLAGIEVSVSRLYYGFTEQPGVILSDPRGYEEIVHTSSSGDTLYQSSDRNTYIRIIPNKTDKDGVFQIISGNFPMDTLKYNVKFTDTNASMSTDSVWVTFVAKNLKGGDGDWYYGKAEKEITMVLKPEAKKETNE